MANYLAAEGLIVTRLASQISTRVYTAPDLPAVIGAGDPLPAVYVVHGRDVITEPTSFNGINDTIDQAWIVAVKIAYVPTTMQNVNAQSQAGEIIDSVITALRGYVIGADYGPLRRTTGPRDGYDESVGAAIYPIQFLTRYEPA